MNADNHAFNTANLFAVIFFSADSKYMFFKITKARKIKMTYNIMCLAAGLLTTFPAIGDTRNMKTPVIVAVIAIVLIVGCLILSSKPKNKDDKK